MEAAKIRARWAAILAFYRGRKDSEHGQAIIRLALGIAIMAYSLWIARTDPAATIGTYGAGLAGLLILYTMANFVALTIWPAPSRARRYLSIAFDSTCLGLYLIVGGASASLFAVFYLWILLGNGLRYGNRYLYISLLCGALSFAAVLWASPYWRRHLHLGWGIFIILFVVSAYAAHLIDTMVKSRRRAEEANRTKSQFVANMSHELKTPLNGIIGMLDLVSRTPLKGNQGRYIRNIRQASSELAGLIEGILDLTKLESGSVPVVAREFDFYEACVELLGGLREQATRKGLALNVQMDPALPIFVRTDWRLVSRVLSTLTSNAIKFTNRGTVTVLLSNAGSAPHGLMLNVDVIDTGIGISSEAIGAVFNRFEQVDNRITRTYGGSGLGTAIAKEIVELLHGEIGVVSELDTGSRFWFRIPVEAGRGSREPGYLREPLTAWVGAPPGASRDQAADIVRRFGFECTCTPLAQAWDRLTQPAVRDDKEIFILVTPRPRPRERTVVPFCVIDGALTHAGCQAWAEIGCAACVSAGETEEQLPRALHLLALLHADATATAEQVERAVPARALERSVHVLLAEDNDINAEIYATVLEDEGYSVGVVRDGKTALRYLNSGLYDLAVLDVHMPELDGVSVVREYRRAHAYDQGIPIVMLTADATDNVRHDALEAGISAFITKPVDVLQFASSVADVLRGKTGVRRPCANPEARAPSQERQLTEEVLDVAYLHRIERLRSGPDGPKKAIALVERFLEQIDERCDKIHAALAEHQGAAAAEEAHRLKGGAASLGAKRMAALCADIEQVGENHQWSGVDDIRRILFHVAAETRTELRAYLLRIAEPKQLDLDAGEQI